MNRPLTARQQAVYDFIRDKILNRGYGPTVREIGEHLDIRSPNGVMCHLRALERKEMIRRLANKSRAIELTEAISRQAPLELPLAGRVDANSCTVNFELMEQIGFTEFFQTADRFLLQVSGDSLIHDHLLSGDYLIVQKRADSEPGQLVVAKSVDGQMKLKYWQPESATMKYANANISQSPMVADGVVVVGIVKGVIREMR